ncbi:aspartate aminotransferase family protein [Streptomyces sp. NPDC017941]|uniref:aspartate aminotransferase family protein n=1 Tax=Streptomyces sp. NPDC017941 TaxID=3365018 RepID=UPI003799D223
MTIPLSAAGPDPSAQAAAPAAQTADHQDRDRLFAARQSLAPLPFARAEGSWLHLTDGRRVLDAASGLICVNVGHGRPSVVRALTEQAAVGAFASPGALRPGPQEQLARRLTRLVGRPDDRVVLASTGTAAVEMAISLARLAQRARGGHRRHRVLTASLSYHGNSALTLGLSGHRRRRPHSDDAMGLAPAFDPPYPGMHRGCRYAQCRADCADAVRDALGEDPESVAAVLLEPVNGTTGGAYEAPDGYLARVRSLCADQGVLTLHDEVLTGLGRTGGPLAADHRPGASADITVLSKGLGAGYLPISAVLVAPRLAEDVLAAGTPLPMMGTMSATPLQAAVGLAVLDVLEDTGALTDAQGLGTRLGRDLRRTLATVPAVTDVRGRGHYYGVELAPGTLHEAMRRTRERGLLLYPFNGYRHDGGGEGLIVAPPLTASADELDFLTEHLRPALADLPGPTAPPPPAHPGPATVPSPGRPTTHSPVL